MYVHSKQFILCVSILKTTKAIASVKFSTLRMRYGEHFITTNFI